MHDIKNKFRRVEFRRKVFDQIKHKNIDKYFQAMLQSKKNEMNIRAHLEQSGNTGRSVSVNELARRT